MKKAIKRLRDSAFYALLRSSEPWLFRLGGGRDDKDGRTLDPQLGVMLAAMRALGLKDPDGVEETRRFYVDESETLGPKYLAMAEERELSVRGAAGGLRARLYRPTTAKSRPGVLVFFHGGGFVVGSIASHDLAVRRLAHESGALVLSVDYRLAPEHKFPAAPDDCFAAYTWARDNAASLGADPERVGVGGDSAGGNLSAVITHDCRDRGVRQPTVQLLIYPATDLTRSFPSHRTFGSGYFLEKERLDWYLDRYLNSRAEETHPRGSPLLQKGFEGLAPAIVVTAGFDVLRDEGESYAKRLEAAGVVVDYTCEDGMIHGFFNMSGPIAAASAGVARMASKLGAYLA